MQSAALGVREIVPLVICDEVDDASLGESGGLVENEPPCFDACSDRAHVTTVGRPACPGKRASRALARDVPGVSRMRHNRHAVWSKRTISEEAAVVELTRGASGMMTLYGGPIAWPAPAA